ncbi:transcription factor-like protein DPB [Bidens hawaiensis]|uniref:transcription factor-like protein DPB n=1 Tax=Bidens hawaiensis TaxID=980011 RepID=UPI004049B2DF
MGLNNNNNNNNPSPILSIRSWGTTASGQSVSTSGSEAAYSVGNSTISKLNHLDIHADDAGSHGVTGNAKKKRAPRATGVDKNGRGLRQFSMKGLNNNNNNNNPSPILSRRSWGTTVSGQSVSTSGSEAAYSVGNSTISKLNYLDIHADDAGSQGVTGNTKKKRAPRATGADKNGRGLRQFSMKVCEKVESKGSTTYNEVADELVAEFADPGNGAQASNQQQFNEKNIRRRVYDALNVLMAMDIISKDKKEIHWKGLPQSNFSNIEELKKNRLAIQSRFEKKSAYLRELEDQYVGLQNLIQRNEQLYSSGNAPTGGVALPFILVQTRPHATVEVEMSEDMQLFHFDFSSTPFEIHDDNHVLKAMKLCDQSKGGDDMANDRPMDGGACLSPSPTLEPQSTTTLSARPSTSPPLPGILKARAKNEH